MVSKKLGSFESFVLKSSWFWAAILLVGLLGFLAAFPDFVKTYYRELFFYYLRVIADPLLNIIPFSPFWIFIFVVLANTFHGIREGSARHLSWYLNGAGKLIIWFYLLWGFNYSAPGMKEEMALHTDHQNLDVQAYRSLIQDFESQLSPSFFANYRRGPSADVSDVRKVVADFLKRNQLKAPGKPRVQQVRVPLLRWLGISGIYLPYTLEAYADGSLAPAQLTFTVAHELSHAYGFTSEAEANFIACAAFIESEDETLVQIAYLELILESLRRVRQLDPVEFETVYGRLSEDVLEEIEFRKTDRAKYQNWFWKISEISNDRYLKLQGEAEGIASYSGFLELYLSWQAPTTP